MRWFKPRAFSGQRFAELRPAVGYEMAKLELSPSTSHELRWLFAKAIPNETGGLIFADGLVVQCPNVAPDPVRHYETDIEMNDQIFAFWHTHPSGPNFLSSEDMNTMSEMYCLGMRYPWVVVGPETITSWHLRDPASL